MSRRTGTIPFIFLALESFVISDTSSFKLAFQFSTKTGLWRDSAPDFFHSNNFLNYCQSLICPNIHNFGIIAQNGLNLIGQIAKRRERLTSRSLPRLSHPVSNLARITHPAVIYPVVIFIFDQRRACFSIA
jgi:hypothetical protein